MITVEINPKDGQLQAENTQNGERFFQRAYLDVGGAYPLAFTLSLPNATSAYPAGKYKMNGSAFGTNKYGGLEVNQYKIKLDKVA